MHQHRSVTSQFRCKTFLIRDRVDTFLLNFCDAGRYNITVSTVNGKIYVFKNMDLKSIMNSMYFVLFHQFHLCVKLIQSSNFCLRFLLFEDAF